MRLAYHNDDILQMLQSDNTQLIVNLLHLGSGCIMAFFTTSATIFVSYFLFKGKLTNVESSVK
jgi:hypothetical protein